MSYLAVHRERVEPATSRSPVRHVTITLPNHAISRLAITFLSFSVGQGLLRKGHLSVDNFFQFAEFENFVF